MGITGATIGFYLGGIVLIILGLLLGSTLGVAVAEIGARRFFLSVLVGLLVGSTVSLLLGQEGTLVILAGTGAAVGGFIGINIELLRRRDPVKRRF